MSIQQSFDTFASWSRETARKPAPDVPKVFGFTTPIDALSATSLFVQPRFGETIIGRGATAFAIRSAAGYFLITNWHVAALRNSETNECLHASKAEPDLLSVWFHRTGAPGHFVEQLVRLRDGSGNPLWIEHPAGRSVDVVAIPFIPDRDVTIYPLNLDLRFDRLLVEPMTTVAVIGYPHGIRVGGHWPVWKTGNVASDYYVDYEEGRPAFLIDAAVVGGMSGSPVIARARGTFTEEGRAGLVTAGSADRFLGVYSGRIGAESTVGRVWRAYVISEILERKLLYGQHERRSMPLRLSMCPCGSRKRFKSCCGQFIRPTQFRSG